MPRFRLSMLLGPVAIVFPLCVCGCNNEPPPNPGLGATPPGHVGMNDPRSRGSFDEIPDGKGGLIKKWAKTPARR